MTDWLDWLVYAAIVYLLYRDIRVRDALDFLNVSIFNATGRWTRF